MAETKVFNAEEIRREKHYDIAMLMITNVLREGTELLFSGDSEIIRSAFPLEGLHGNQVFLRTGGVLGNAEGFGD